MKTLVVYYSMGGNTAWAAERIASTLGADILRIFPRRAYPDKGFRKFLWAGKSAVMAEEPPLEPYEIQGEGYDRVVIGFPVWAGNIAPPLRTLIREQKEMLADKVVAAFACQSGAGAEKAFVRLRQCLGGKELTATAVLIDPKDRPNERAENEIRVFCRKLGA